MHLNAAESTAFRRASATNFRCWHRSLQISNFPEGRTTRNSGGDAQSVVIEQCSELHASREFGCSDILRCEKLRCTMSADLSALRVNTGWASARAARRVGAQAFTLGQDFHFSHGTYDPYRGRGSRSWPTKSRTPFNYHRVPHRRVLTGMTDEPPWVIERPTRLGTRGLLPDQGCPEVVLGYQQHINLPPIHRHNRSPHASS